MSLPANALPTAAPESVGLSPDRLERLSRAMRGYVERGELAGTATLIARRGRLAHLGTFGLANREEEVPIRPDTIYRIASMTKPITSLAAMMLFEEGKFFLNDPVEKYLPEFADARVAVRNDDGSVTLVPSARSMTVRHLFTHTSGLTYGGPEHLTPFYRKAAMQSGGLDYARGTIADAVKRLGQVPLLFHPGDRYEYGYNTDVLGRLVEVWSGLSLDGFFKTRIFEPLKMVDTHFFVPTEKVARLARVYTLKNGALEWHPAEHAYEGERTFFAGGAGLNSTILDYARFCQMFLNGGELDGERLLSRKTVELMTRNQIGGLDSMGGPGYKFGLGFEIHSDPNQTTDIRSKGSYTWGGYWHTTFWIDPMEELIAVKMAQILSAEQLNDHEMFRVLVYQAIV